MSGIFSDIYFKKIGLNENAPTSKHYVAAKKLCERAWDLLMKELSAEQQKQFNEFCDRSAAVTAELEYLCYKEGFRVGLLLGFEMSELSSEK